MTRLNFFDYRLRYARVSKAPWYDSEHIQGIMKNSQYKLLWNKPFCSPKQLQANMPDHGHIDVSMNS